jgi:hypothetical protein
VFESFDYAKLNGEAKRYLRDVRGRGARGGLPGVFFAVSDNRPIWAALAGGVVLPLFLWIGYTSTKAPWATAMLQTAGILLGGWLLWFAGRRWLANTDQYAGYFYYFDSRHAFIGEGETIRVAPMHPTAKVTPHGANAVLVESELEDRTIPVPNRVFAEAVSDFYHALAWVRSREEGPWANLEDDEAGAVARFLAEEDEAPQNLTEADLAIDSFTDTIRATGRSKSGIFGLLVWCGIGAASFALFATTNGIIQDNMAFAEAKGNIGKFSGEKYTGAQGLRDYLLNERNTRNRDEAKELLAKLYDAPIAQVKSNPAADPVLRDGMVALLESLRGPETPAVSIAAIDSDSPTETNLAKGLRSRFADGIATAVGKDLIAFGVAPPDKPALLTIRYTRTSENIVDWSVEIRLKPDDTSPFQAKGVATYFGTVGMQASPFGQTVELATSDTDAMTEAVYSSVMMKLLGQAPGKPAAITNDDW